MGSDSFNATKDICVVTMKLQYPRYDFTMILQSQTYK